MFQRPYWAKKGKHIFPSALIKISSARISLTLGRFPHLRTYNYKFYSNFPRLLLSITCEKIRHSRSTFF